MQIVIEISEADYKYFKSTSFVEHEDCLRQSPEDRRGTMKLFRLVDAVKDGIVLPKRHGRLIDADKLNRKRKYGFKTEHAWEALAYAETVVPADKEGES